jgi:hypothetical protein
LVSQGYCDVTGLLCIGDGFWFDQTVRIEKE